METSSIKIVGSPRKSKDLKRLFLPGAQLLSSCPRCGVECKRDMGSDYFSNPEFNIPIKHIFYHDCNFQDSAGEWQDCEWEVEIQINVSITTKDTSKP